MKNLSDPIKRLSGQKDRKFSLPLSVSRAGSDDSHGQERRDRIGRRRRVDSRQINGLFYIPTIFPPPTYFYCTRKFKFDNLKARKSFWFIWTKESWANFERVGGSRQVLSCGILSAHHRAPHPPPPTLNPFLHAFPLACSPTYSIAFFMHFNPSFHLSSSDISQALSFLFFPRAHIFKGKGGGGGKRVQKTSKSIPNITNNTYLNSLSLFLKQSVMI